MPAKKKTTKSAKKAPPAKKTSPKKENKATATKVSSSRLAFLSTLGSKVNPSKLKGINKPQLKWRRAYWGVAAAIVVIGLTAYFAATKLVVAWVDNRPITFFEFYGQLNTKYGSDLKEQLISQRLVEDEASRRHVSVSDQEINNQINTIKQQSAGQGDFNQLLAQQGLTLDELKQQVKLQIMIQKMFGQNITVTDDEVNKYIEANKNQFPQTDNNTKVQVKQQLEQQKLVDSFRAWLQTQQQSKRVVRL